MKSNLPEKSQPGNLIKSSNLFPVVGVGASAGGLDAFKKLLKAIPEDAGMAWVLVQHLDPSHESLLPEILQKVTRIPVLEIADDVRVEPNHIYVIPSNKMMLATDGVLQLAPRPAKSKTERNLPIDLFFTSLAEVHQEHAIGVVLSGTASDGTQGLKAIKDQGGITFAQDEASAEYEGMPHSAAQAGVVDFILPPEQIPKKLLEVTSKTILSDEELQNIPKPDEDVFKQILSLLRIRKGVDFTYYKQTTIRRRILRRMVVNKNEEPADYLKFLRGNTAEQDLLYQDMLIPVTSFFRDKKPFENLCNNIFPSILKNKIPGEITRIWVAGCSTGQEVYSFAICFKEFLGDDHERIQIFGTDLSEPAIIKARTGLYEKSEVDAVSPERLKEYFTKNNGGYLVNKSIRDMCVFAHHNFLKDPPFGKMDCISCRNVLIYMELYLQKKALTTFHYALNPKGFLLLGKSETTGSVPDLFAAVEKNDKLYTRKDVPGRFMHVTSQRSEQILHRPADSVKSETIRTDFQKTADDILLTKYTPAGVVVNETMDIVHFRGNTANFLEQAPGKPSHNLLMMAKHGLGFELRNILYKAKTDKLPVVKDNIPLSVQGSIRNISIEAVPLPNTLEPYYLILFHDNQPAAISNQPLAKKTASAKNQQLTASSQQLLRIQLLEQELAQAREDMRSITEDQEASNEELQSANEELLSGSEELQSLNEELETSKEELQSTNEELTVLNHELIGLNEQVTDARNYSESIVATLYQPLLVLDKNLRIKTANKAFYKTFNANEQETEGVLIYDLGNRQWNFPQLRTLLEEVLPQKKQITDFEVTHNFTSIGERIILLNALEITREKKEEKLILLSIQDITNKREADNLLQKSTLRFRHLVQELPAAVYSCDKNGLINFYNKAAAKIWGREPEIGKDHWCSSFKMFNTDGLPLPAETCPMAVALKEGRAIAGEEIIIERPDGSHSIVQVYPQPEFDVSGKITGATNMAFDISEQVAVRKKIEESEKRIKLALEAGNMGTFIWYPLEDRGEPDERMRVLFGVDKDAEINLSEAIGKMIHPDDIILYTEAVKKALDINGKGILREDIRIQHANGSLHWISVFGQTVFENGLATSMTGMVVDITYQVVANKKIEESENQFRQMAELMPQKIWTADAEGNKNYFNNTLLDYAGFTFEELIGSGWQKLIHPDDWEENKTQWEESISTGNDYETENRLLRKDGEYLWHLTRAVAIKDEAGEIKSWIGSKTEIQEQREQKQVLEKAVEKRTTELQAANQKLIFENVEKEKRAAELNMLNKELESFAYVSSHDLQEPLRKIQTFAGRILEKENEKLSDSGKKYFHIMQDSANRMQKLIEDLLTFSGLTTAERKFETTDLNVIVENVKTALKETIEEKHATIIATELCPANIIVFQFNQLMQNLIANALKFSKPEKPPRITIKGRIEKGYKIKSLQLSPEKDYCHVSVTDNGIGFEKEFSEKIFEVFQKLHGREEYAGTGIGLAIVKKIVDNHNGFITASSKLNKGTTFDIYLPAN